MKPGPEILHGSCDCGGLSLEFVTALEPGSLTPRACDCSFCRKHGAAYVSDPAGSLTVRENRGGALHGHRQGSKSAEFVLCSECGVLLAATYAGASRVYGAVNARCLDSRDELGVPQSASPQHLSVAEKVARWTALWVPDVALLRFPGAPGAAKP